MPTRLPRLPSALLGGLLAAAAASAQSPMPPTPAPVRFGQSAPLSGPTAPLGRRVRAGILAAIHEANAAGGLDGHPIELVSLDDGYEPARTAVNMRQLIDQHGVLAVLGSVGAPCAVTAVPIAQEKRTLLYGYFTGGSVLRKAPADHYVVNFRAGLAEEVAVLVDQFVARGIGVGEIAFFTQQDAYGDSAFAGGLAALRRHGLRDERAVPHVRYERNTSNIESGLSDLLLLDPEPRAVVFAGAGGPTVAFLREAGAAGFRPLVGAFSFVDARYVADELGALADGLIVTQVVPPFGSGAPALADYQRAMAAAAPGEPESFASLEAYLAARALLAALRRQAGPLDRDRVAAAVRSAAPFDLGLGAGRPVGLRSDGHTIAGYVWPTELRGGRVVPLRDPPAAPAPR